MSKPQAIVLSEAADLYCLPVDLREEIQLLHRLFEEVESSGEVVSQLEKLVPLFDGRSGVSFETLKRKYYAWKKSGHDWKSLLDRRKVSFERRISLPPETIEWFRGLCERNQRKCKPAWREACRRWMSGQEIPGLGVKPEHSHALPPGFSYSNMMHYAPTKFELTATRIGRSAAAKYRPLVFTTRAGLACGQHLMFDDLVYDHKVNFPGINREAMRPLELGCLDVFSGCKIAWGMKPTTINDETGAKEMLKEREMRFLVAHILFNVGYRPEGTVLMVEKGTAAIREDIEQVLLDATDGAVTVDRNGMEGAASFAGLYDGRSKGNSRFKAPLESHHNLVHNEFAALPGQQGKDYENCPEEEHGREAHNTALIKACAALPPERAALLRMPYIPWAQFLEIVDIVYARINARTDHKLEGWEEANLLVNEFRVTLDSAWQPMSWLSDPRLDPREKAAIEAVCCIPGHVRLRRMSPTEVWQAGNKGFAKIHARFIPAILGPDLAVERKLHDNHLFEFEDRLIGPGVHHYEARVQTVSGRVEMLKPGDYLTHVNPFNSDMLFVSAGTRNGMQYIGVAPRWVKVPREDTEALHRQMGAATHVLSELLAPVAARGAELTRQRIADAKHNADVLSGKPITPKEIENRARIKASTGDLSALMPDAPATESEDSQLEKATADLDRIF